MQRWRRRFRLRAVVEPSQELAGELGDVGDVKDSIVTNYQYDGPPGAGSFVKAQKGDVIILWATGGGLTSPVGADNQLAPATGDPMLTVPSVPIAGSVAGIQYPGMSPNFIGLYQINVAVPPDTPSGKVTLTLASGIGDVNYDLWVQSIG